MNRRTFNQLASLSALGALTATTNVVAQSNASPVKRPRFSEPDPIDFNNHAGFTSIFDGKTLSQWDGNPDVWKVEDGAIVGISTRESPSGNTFIVYHGAHAKDFDLKLEIKVENGGGSGVQYRSHTGYPPPGGTGGRGRPGEPLAPPPRTEWTMIGPQADFWYPENAAATSYTGQFYSQNTGRDILAWRGQVVNTLPGKAPLLVADIGNRTVLGSCVRTGDWNQYNIMVRGGVFMHVLNGQLLAVLIDDDPASSNNVDGLFGLQIEGYPSKVSFRNLWMKKIN